ncbi:RidA family protein [Thalassomonas viridans]|uniref:RidA family protein n=1 Tax=Thalassomonas viridans TaxID=137584 RepID=A0AAE9Z872_9GAMM|nr:RidA family protein [Thalassomonas viridans]WDE08047.1 RidA family protein [Thalassomonas viridans]
MHKTRIQTNAAAPVLGTYSQGIRASGDIVFLSGQTGRNEDGEMESGIEAQTHRTLANIDAVLNSAGCGREDIARVTLLMADIKDYKVIDQIYAAWLPGDTVTPAKPTRTAFEVPALPAGALVMIEVTAISPT